MNSENTRSMVHPKTFIDTVIRMTAIAALAVLCFHVASPFLDLLAWGLILAVTLYPLHQRIARRLEGRQGLAATLIVLIGCPLIGTPLWLLGSSFADRVEGIQTAYDSQELRVEPPEPGVADWPVIGEEAFSVWSQAAESLPAFLEKHAQKVDKFWKRVAVLAKEAVSSAFMFVGAFIISAVMMAYGKPGSRVILLICKRISGPVTGPELQSLSVATVRSVAVGVLGVAVIQGLLFGIGCLMSGIPAAGVLALIVFFMGIFQLSGIFFALPAIIYLWVSGDASVVANLLYTVYFVFAGLADNVLKPLLLARGVDAPMPVILIGALGGMVTGGFIGMFLGAILLAIGYRIFMKWVHEADDPVMDSPSRELQS